MKELRASARRILHHLVAHPLLILAPGLGEPLHAATVPETDESSPLDVVAGVGLVMVLLAAPQVCAALVLSLILRRVSRIG